MNRRNLLSASAFIAPVFLIGCTGAAPTVSQLALYAQTAANAAADILAQAGASASSTLSGYLNTITSAAAAIVANAPAAGASFAQQLYDAAKAVLPVGASLLSSIPGVGLGLAALQALLPLIASLAGLQAAGLKVALVPGIPVVTVAQAVKQYGTK